MRRFRFAKTLVINIAVTLVLAEAGLFIYYWAQNRAVVPPAELFTRAFGPLSPPKFECAWGEKIALHPYFGIAYAQGGDCPAKTNSYGLHGPELPFKKDPAKFTILVTGASVAEQVGGNTMVNGENYLEYDLNSKWKPPRGESFAVLNAAMAATAQPVTFFQTVLQSPVADQIISIEGFNEHNLVARNEPLEQASEIWKETAYRADHPLQSWLLTQCGRLAKESALARKSYLAFAVLSETQGRIYRRLQATRGPFPPLPAEWSPEKKQEFLLNSYLRYVELSQALARYEKKDYTLFIQPAPYAYKTLTAEEEAVVGNLQTQRNYDFIKGALKRRSPRLHVESLEKIFENVTMTLYVDPIHTNKDGIKIISEQIAEKLAKRYGWKNK